MRLASFLVLLTMLLSGCGIKGALYLPEKKPAPVASQPSEVPEPMATQQNTK